MDWVAGFGWGLAVGILLDNLAFWPLAKYLAWRRRCRDRNDGR